ncbi:MAG: outer membrane beta-barrel protein [Deltaproteobacteria bacterium]|nr:outer membrane beta-barrel protein [Deltaproteobacteria bacterium]
MFALTIFFASPVRAESGKLELGVSPHYAYLLLDNRHEPDGWGVGLQLRYGLSDTFGLVVAGLWTMHSIEGAADKVGGDFHVMTADFGLVYTLDLVRFLPRIEAGVGALHRRFADAYSTDLGVRLGLSVDYQISPRWMVGLSISYHGFVTDLANIPMFVEMGPRITWTWSRQASAPSPG